MCRTLFQIHGKSKQLNSSPGGTIVPGGGYVAGKEKLIGAVAARLAAPGIGIDAGQVSGTTLRLMYQGLFLASQTTGESLKGGRLVAEVLSREGFSVYPAPGMRETFSMITAIHLGSREGMEAFCKAVQRMSPVGSYIEPVPGEAVQRMVPVCSGTRRQGSSNGSTSP